MPTYQYACTECGERLEAVQSFSDEPLTVCPACSGRLRKLFNSVGIVFKGSGFYRTDSRNGKDKAESPAASSSSESSSKSESTSKTESTTKSDSSSSTSSSPSSTSSTKSSSTTSAAA